MKICILGATGLVGRETLDLVERAWPGAERLEAADAAGGELAFVALDDDHSARYVPRLLDLGYRVVDKSNTYRMDPKVPLVVAGVNCDLLTSGVRLAANPNCTTIAAARRAYAEPDRLGARLDPAGYTGNTVPHNGKTDESGFSSEERRLMFES